MKIKELEEKLFSGLPLIEILPMINGQECLIYKGDWDDLEDDDIIYIKDTCDYGDCREPFPAEEIPSVIEQCCYMKGEFLSACNGNERIAKDFLEWPDWETPDIDQYLESYDDDEFFEEFGVRKEHLKK